MGSEAQLLKNQEPVCIETYYSIMLFEEKIICGVNISILG